jgi:hypothetical protein
MTTVPPFQLRHRSLPERLLRLPVTFWTLYGVGRGRLSRRQRLRIAATMAWISLTGPRRRLHVHARDMSRELVDLLLDMAENMEHWATTDPSDFGPGVDKPTMELAQRARRTAARILAIA